MTDRPRCTAMSKRSGKPCGNWPLTGATVCRIHGAGKNTPARKKAERKTQEAAAMAAIVSYGLPREIDPHTALLEELWHTAGHVAWLRAKVAELDEDGLWTHVGGGEMSDPRQDPIIWLRLYQEERKHLASVARDCIRAGIEERRVKLAEQQGALLASVIRGILTDLGVADRPEAATVVRKHLTLAASG